MPTATNTRQELFTVSQIALLTASLPQTIRRMIERGAIPPEAVTKVGRTYRIRRSWLESAGWLVE